MNFLAHCLLSGDNEKVLVGNFIADFVKGKQALASFDKEISTGIALHRFIDAYTDTHATVHQSKKRLRAKYRHYANVIVDVFYDHFLASQWSNYNPVPLKDYARSVYNTIQSYDLILPEGVKYMLPYMMGGNWLYNYSKVEGIGRALHGMSQRTSYDSKMNEATHELSEHYDAFRNEFNEFFPDLAHECNKWIASH
jgi:acyl carrier protein phosphodiesterase